MKINYEGRTRKELAAAISEITGEKTVYMRAPTYAYQIGAFTIERYGELVSEDAAKLDELLRELAGKALPAKRSRRKLLKIRMPD